MCVTSKYTAARGQSVRRRSFLSVSRYGPTLPRDADRGRLTHEMEGLIQTLYSAIYISQLLECHSQSVLLLTLAYYGRNYAAKFTLLKFFFSFTNDLLERKLKSNIKIIHNCTF